MIEQASQYYQGIAKEVLARFANKYESEAQRVQLNDQHAAIRLQGLNQVSKRLADLTNSDAKFNAEQGRAVSEGISSHVELLSDKAAGNREIQQDFRSLVVLINSFKG